MLLMYKSNVTLKEAFVLLSLDLDSTLLPIRRAKVTLAER